MKRPRDSHNNTNGEKTSRRSRATIPKWRDALAGAAAGAISKTTMAPVERVKLLLQLQTSVLGLPPLLSSTTLATREKAPRWSAWQVTSHVYRTEGALAFWKGNVANVIRTGGQAGLNFMLMDYYKLLAHQAVDVYSLSSPAGALSTEPTTPPRPQHNFLISFLSGGLAGGTATTVLYPIEYIRTRLAVDSVATTARAVATTEPSSIQLTKSVVATSMRSVLQSTYEIHGIRGFYQGYGIALWGSVLYRLLLLGGYDAMKCKRDDVRAMSKITTPTNDKNDSNSAVRLVSAVWLERLVLAQSVSTVAGTICYPIDSIRRRLMMQAGRTEQHSPRYRNSVHCMQVVWQQEGIRGFYLGLGPNLIRSVGGAIMLVLYDACKDVMAEL